MHTCRKLKLGDYSKVADDLISHRTQTGFEGFVDITENSSDKAGGAWIFGYGSLVWRPDFPFIEKRVAAIEGWERRFWQGSTDHRGVPGAPGRVVTLIESAGALCHGMAYRVESAVYEDVMATLDHREKGGYSLKSLALTYDGSPIGEPEAHVYIATEGNPNYLGPATLDHIAAQVRRSRGPSGHNAEYVTRLAEALRRMNAHDDHVFALEHLVLAE
jgi:glutathione-specific gamma-glutamylcyclotransferase